MLWASLLLQLQAAGAPATHSIEDALVVTRGAAACLEPDELAQQLRVWTEGVSLDARLKIRVVEDPQLAGRASFELWDGEQRLEVRVVEPLPVDCDAAHAALGLAIAFTLDATLLQELGGESEAQTSEGEAEAAPVELLPADPNAVGEGDSSPLVSRTWPRIGLVAEGVAGAGLTPALALGAQAGLRFDLGAHASVAATGGYLHGFARQLGEGQVSGRLGYARVEGCGGGRLGPADLRACGGVMAGRAWLEGEGYLQDRSARAAWVGATLGGGLRVPADQRLSFVFDANLVLPLLAARSEIVDLDTGTVTQSVEPSPVAALVGLGLSVQLP